MEEPFFICHASPGQIVELSITSNKSCRSGELVRVAGPDASGNKIRIVRRFGNHVESIYRDRVCFATDLTSFPD